MEIPFTLQQIAQLSRRSFFPVRVENDSAIFQISSDTEIRVATNGVNPSICVQCQGPNSDYQHSLGMPMSLLFRAGLMLDESPYGRLWLINLDLRGRCATCRSMFYNAFVAISYRCQPPPTRINQWFWNEGNTMFKALLMSSTNPFLQEFLLSGNWSTDPYNQDQDWGAPFVWIDTCNATRSETELQLGHEERNEAAKHPNLPYESCESLWVFDDWNFFQLTDLDAYTKDYAAAVAPDMMKPISVFNSHWCLNEILLARGRGKRIMYRSPDELVPLSDSLTDEELIARAEKARQIMR
ncbi:uncharacterized protein N7482_004422 [Penicillium canariense]|uniref:Uncharacterized protein n=1 Tax=Penicillium canariense TaxID=189055 RepID=A0A9W9I8P2_9EURO|nr:uncharacterized protein N7482_004422 [Penicillium canariense]KAJ5168828.1 hypothetical protein N7482_004422 [Penicillium canariense]